eukprot:215267-Rhodomonas_salina.1
MLDQPEDGVINAEQVRRPCAYLMGALRCAYLIAVLVLTWVWCYQWKGLGEITKKADDRYYARAMRYPLLTCYIVLSVLIKRTVLPAYGSLRASCVMPGTDGAYGATRATYHNHVGMQTPLSAYAMNARYCST